MTNIYLTGSLPRLFAKTAAPIILVMVVNGTFNLVDAYFLGIYVSGAALSAVTMMFPLHIFMVSMATLVSSGFSSVFARLLGAGEAEKANKVFTNVHLLSIAACAIVIGMFYEYGRGAVELVTNGEAELSAMGYTYIQIIVLSSPLMFFLTIHSDALRCEGKLMLMTSVSLLSTILNIMFNYVLIVWWQWGVAGSAYGTVLASLVSLAIIFIYRCSPRSSFKPIFSRFADLRKSCLEIITLGAPMSLGYVGLSLMSGTVIYNIQLWGGEGAASTIGAYGIAIRVLTFFIFPLLGLSIAFQTIAGNNFGAGRMERVNASLRIALMVSFGFCVCAQIAFHTFADTIGTAFVGNPDMISETGRILPMMTMFYFFSGPAMVLSGFFQALGDARRAAILSLPRTFVFLVPLVYVLPKYFGEWGIWYAGPVTDISMMILTAIVLWFNSRSSGSRYGLFLKES